MPERAPRVLYFLHGHPSLVKGGAERAALELFDGIRELGAFEPFLAARSGDPSLRRPGTPFGAVDDDPNQILFFASLEPDEQFFQTMRDKRFYTTSLARLLRTVAPDVVHFQHTAHFGVEAIRLVRATLPDVPIVYTLHEFVPICHAQGQMVKTKTLELCDHASPHRCNGCFPERSPGEFLLRERLIKSQFGLVDRFVAPSRFLLERFASWGLPRDRLTEIDYGRRPQAPADPRPLPSGGKRDRFGFFGQLNPYKGIRELLIAAQLLRNRGRLDIQIEVSGANLDTQTREFQDELHSLMDDSSQNVAFLGSYGEAELAERISSVDWVVVPSIWWENSPLVIQEAFMHGRPVICSDLGGMAEKVEHGRNGLRFRARHPAALAEALCHAADTEGLWDGLRRGIPSVPTARSAAEAHVAMYDELRERRASQESLVGSPV